MTTDVDRPVAAEDTAPLEVAEAGPPLRVFPHRVTGSSRQRLLDAFPCELVEDAPADLIVVSTRMPLGQVSGALRGFQKLDGVPMVAIVHAGGEDLATEFLRAGAIGLVAEGNEAAIAAVARRGTVDVSLVETYDQRIGRARPSDLGSSGRDPVTGLPSVGTFEAVLAEAGQTGDIPRVGYLRILNFDEAVRRLSDEATALLRRRLSAQLREIGRLYGAELYAASPTLLAYVALGLTPEDARELGHLLARATESFAPSGGRHLTLAVGHAGPEVTAEASAVRDLAHRAMELASTGTGSVVLSADDLSRTLAATTELGALLRMVEAVERTWHGGTGRGQRVAELAAQLAQQLGFEGLERSQIRLAAHLHEVGKISLSDELAGDPEALTAAQEEELRRYPGTGADFLRVSGGTEVALAVRHHEERWDGEGFPDGLAEEEIPIGSRIIAVARAIDDARTRHRDPAALERELDRLTSEAGTRFDPTVIGAARAMLRD